MQLEKLREGMFWVAGELFGMSFANRSKGCSRLSSGRPGLGSESGRAGSNTLVCGTLTPTHAPENEAVPG